MNRKRWTLAALPMALALLGAPGTSTVNATPTPAPIGDGGGSETYDPGVDLVVSRVSMIREVTATGERRIKITPYVKNMWRGRTRTRIKVLLRGLDRARWIETGIGPNEEKTGGPQYMPDPGGRTELTFDVAVDYNDTIPENNESNNICAGVILASRMANRGYTCPIVGPHERLH